MKEHEKEIITSGYTEGGMYWSFTDYTGELWLDIDHDDSIMENIWLSWHCNDPKDGSERPRVHLRFAPIWRRSIYLPVCSV